MRKEKLSSLCDIINGYAFKSNDYVAFGHRLIRITNVQKGLVVDDNPKFIPETIANKASSFKLKLGDILISLTGNVGRVGRIQACHLPAVLNQRVGLIRPTSSDIDDKFLFQYLNSDCFEKEAVKNSNGVAQLNLSSKWVENHQVPLPPLEDQKRIAHLLSKVEELIVQRKEKLQQLDDLLKSVFLEMFGDPVRNEKGWEKKTFSEISDSRLGKMRDKQFITGNHLRKYVGNSNVQWFRFNLTNLEEMDFDEKERQVFKLSFGDLLICEGGDIGRCAIWRENAEECYFQKALHRVKLNSNFAIAEYVQYVMLFYSLFNGFKNVTCKATIAHLTGEKLKETSVPLPPIALQKRFAAIVKKVERLKSHYQQSLTELGNLSGILSQKAFKGQLDLARVPFEEEVHVTHKTKISEAPAGAEKFRCAI